jgi:DNA-binding HxlR family transcriptional regulator
VTIPIGDEMCPRYQRAIEILGKRWTGLIIRTLLVHPRRFGEITEVVQGLSDRLLSERLKELESCDIVERRVFPDTPVRIEYALSAKGLELEQVVEAIQHWADCWDEVTTARMRKAAHSTTPTHLQPVPNTQNEPAQARSSLS